jgi:internalin A
MGAGAGIRRRGQFTRRGLSIRALLMLVSVVALFMTWFARTSREAKLQRKSVEAVTADGGIVLYDWQLRDGKLIKAVRPPWPRWLVRRYGIDFFANVVDVDFGLAVSDVQLGHLDGLRRLERLELSNSAVTDRGLVHLEGLSRLKSLNLAETSISDSGIIHLGRLVSLKSLDLHGTNIGDEALATIAGLTSLEELSLHDTDVGDAGLAHLHTLTRLRILDLFGTDVSDRGLVHLKGMKRLELLDAVLTRVTAFGAQELGRELPRVRVLSRTSFVR